MGGMEAWSSWFGASTLLKNVKKLWLLVSQVVNFRKRLASATYFYLSADRVFKVKHKRPCHFHMLKSPNV